jgi:hypothetical protein
MTNSATAVTVPSVLMVLSQSLQVSLCVRSVLLALTVEVVMVLIVQIANLVNTQMCMVMMNVSCVQ